MKELERLYEQLIQENTKKVDVIAPLASTEFIADRDKNYLLLQTGETLPSEYHNFGFNNIRDRVMELSPHALQQLCSKIGVPMSYLSKCQPEVREYNINHWLQKSQDHNLFRCMVDRDSKRVRGILSDRYTPVDDSFVIASLNRAIEESNLENPLVTKMYTGEDMMRVQVTDRKKPVVGDTTLGFFIGNSEVGLSRIYIEMGLYTYRCTNGLRVPTFSMEFNRKHIGTISHNMITDNFQNQIAGIMNNYSHMMQYMNIAGQISIQKSKFKSYIENSKEFSLEFNDSMKSRIRQLPAKNVLWAYVSQMTEQAQQYREYERMEIEKHAGKYLDEIVMKEVKKGRYELAKV